MLVIACFAIVIVIKHFSLAHSPKQRQHDYLSYFFKNEQIKQLLLYDTSPVQ